MEFVAKTIYVYKRNKYGVSTELVQTISKENYF